MDADNQPVKNIDKSDDKKQAAVALKGAEAFVPLSDDLWDPLIEYYGLSDENKNNGASASSDADNTQRVR